jgi:hypothetical protein
LLLASWAHPGIARAQSEPSAEDVRAAGDSFNQGRTAFEAENFPIAAEHFERADQLAPNPKVLLLAIQSRERSGQLARAATLAALAQDRYPEDASLAATRDLIERALAEFGKLKVSCDTPCSLLIDSRIVHGEAATKRFLFLEAGSYKVRASWSGGAGETQEFVAVAGESGKLDFIQVGQPPAAVDDWSETSGEPKQELPAPKATYDDLSPKAGPVSKDSNGLPPAVFWVGGGLTVALAGASTVMGIYTLSHPGEQAIKDNCDNLGESCTDWKTAKSNELTTNVLWGATAGVGLATILIGTIWTDWGSSDASASETRGANTRANDTQRASVSVQPWILVGDGAAVGARGRF